VSTPSVRVQATVIPTTDAPFVGVITHLRRLTLVGEFDKVQQDIRAAAAASLNAFADKVHSDSEPEVPLKFGELKASALYPANDPASRADPDNLVDGAMVSYNTVYAAAQHEGHAMQHRMHPVIPITVKGIVVGYYTDTSRIYEHDIEWVVKMHTEIGTKTNFLRDPLNDNTPKLERFTALHIAAVLK
jgi:hypothetical protein